MTDEFVVSVITNKKVLQSLFRLSNGLRRHPKQKYKNSRKRLQASKGCSNVGMWDVGRRRGIRLKMIMLRA